MSADLFDAQMPRSKSTSMLLLMHYDTTTSLSQMTADVFDAQMPLSKSTSMLLLMHFYTTWAAGLLSHRCQLIYLMRRCRGLNLQACCYSCTMIPPHHKAFFLSDVSWFIWCADAAFKIYKHAATHALWYHLTTRPSFSQMSADAAI